TASISDATDVDFYRITTAQTVNNQPEVLTVTLRDLDGGAAPHVTIFDAKMNVVAANVLVNGAGSYIVQAPSIQSNATFYLRVTPANGATSNYSLTARSGTQAATLRTFAAGQLDASIPARIYRFFLAESQLFQFTLDAAGSGSVQLTLQNGSGQTIAALTVAAGDAVSLPSLFLAPGGYTLLIKALPDPANPRPTTFRLRPNPLN